uniref:Uncharacterized protein n=1 Tax=Timema douglasi TaxID=61478 RepID=A0A7R8VLP2_TIMDO|nr:unnamed protein product [Timema douglasi]
MGWSVRREGEKRPSDSRTLTCVSQHHSRSFQLTVTRCSERSSSLSRSAHSLGVCSFQWGIRLDGRVGEVGCSATVKWTGNWCTFIDALIQLVLFKDGESSQDIYLPREITQVVIDPSLHTEPEGML